MKSVSETQRLTESTIWLICMKARMPTPVSGIATIRIAVSSVTVAERPTFILDRSRLYSGLNRYASTAAMAISRT